MALIKCFECNTKVSEYADRCPQCGCPISFIKAKNIEQEHKENQFLYNEKHYELIGISQLLKQGEDVKAIKSIMNKLQVTALDAKLIVDVIKFNGYEIPYDYTMCLERMRQHNQNQMKKKEAIKMKCPACGSISIQHVPMAFRILTLFSLRRSRTSGGEYECRECGYTWN